MRPDPVLRSWTSPWWGTFAAVQGSGCSALEAANGGTGPPALHDSRESESDLARYSPLYPSGALELGFRKASSGEAMYSG